MHGVVATSKQDRLLTNITKRIGPTMNPCGTPWERGGAAVGPPQMSWERPESSTSMFGTHENITSQFAFTTVCFLLIPLAAEVYTLVYIGR